MADFTTITMSLNTHSEATPTWIPIGGANTEVRWCDVATAHDTAIAVWPAMIRPAAPAPVRYTYAYSAAAVGHGVYSQDGAVNTPAFTHASWKFARWDWDNTGTFASAPIFTAYPTNAHGAPTPGDGTVLGGHTTDTGVGNFSYLKGEAYGRDDGAGAPAAEPTLEPVITDGTAGAISPAAGAFWIGAFQDLQGDIDYILAPFIPTAASADKWSIMFALFTGPNMVPNLYDEIVLTLRYTWT